IARLDDSFFADASLALLAAASLASVPAHLKNASASRATAYLQESAKWLASFSFTLYVCHVPLIYALQKLIVGDALLNPSDAHSLGLYVMLLVVIVALAYGLSLLTEAHTHEIRRVLKNAVGMSAGSGARGGDRGSPSQMRHCRDTDGDYAPSRTAP